MSYSILHYILYDKPHYINLSQIGLLLYDLSRHALPWRFADELAKGRVMKDGGLKEVKKKEQKQEDEEDINLYYPFCLEVRTGAYGNPMA